MLSWVTGIAGAVVKNAGGADGVETWSFKTPDGHEWELKIKRQGDRLDASREPRISLQDKTRAEKPNVPAFYDPATGTWAGANQPQAHLGLDLSC